MNRCTPGGIGHELALEFLRQGFQVFGTVRSDEAKKTLLSEGVIAIEHEVTSAESIQALHDVLCKRIVDGKLDILINNAYVLLSVFHTLPIFRVVRGIISLTWIYSGISFTVPVLDLTIENMRKVFEINVFGGVLLTQKLAPMLIAAKGKVANIGSVAGVIPYVFGGM